MENKFRAESKRMEKSIWAKASQRWARFSNRAARASHFAGGGFNGLAQFIVPIPNMCRS